MKFLKFINDSYNFERCEKYSGIDYNICNWVFNEIALHWKKDQIEECKAKYGNVKVGVVYRGAKINTEEELEMYHSAQRRGYIDLHLASSSPEKETAKSFAFYIKSYDEITMMRQLVSAIKNGSAGKYGSVLLELEPDPDNVIFKTYVSNNERKGWSPTKCSAEAEVLLHGRVKVKSIEIFEPLTKENWKAIVKRASTSVQALDNDFIKRWIRENKINEEEYLKTSIEVCERFIHSDDNIAYMISNREDLWLHKETLFNFEELKVFARKYFDVNELVTIYNGKKLYLPSEYFKEILDSPNLVKNLVKNINKFEIKNHKGFFYGYVDGKIENDRNSSYTKLVRLCYLNRDVLRYIKNSPFIKSLEEEYLEKVQKYLKVDEYSTEDEMYDLYSFLKFLGYSFEENYYLIRREVIEDTFKKITKKIMSFASGGKMDDQKKLAIKYQMEYISVYDNLNKIYHKIK